MTLLVLIAWRAPRTKPSTFFVGTEGEDLEGLVSKTKR
jgi:hypothetical protein